MSGRQFDPTENSELRAKIDEAKHRLPLPHLLAKFGLEKHAKTSARCPFLDHEDKHPSFSMFKGKDDFWFWKCHSRCGEGDEIAFLQKLKGLSMPDAMNLYLEMAGFPRRTPPKSPQYPESPLSPVSPVSEGQGLEKGLKWLASCNACTARSTARTRRFKLVRDIRAAEKVLGRQLQLPELMIVFDEWYRLSQPFLDRAKTRDDYFAAFVAELGKVRVPTGEGTITTALENVSKLSDSDLPMIPGYSDAPIPWRSLAALHRELSRLTVDGYFLSYRDAAKVCDGLTHQQAHTITFALKTLRVIDIVDNGQAGLIGGKAAEFRYLLPPNENGAEEDDGGLDL